MINPVDFCNLATTNECAEALMWLPEKERIMLYRVFLKAPDNRFKLPLLYCLMALMNYGVVEMRKRFAC